MTNAAVKAGRSLLRDFGEIDKLQISRKGTAGFVTAADVRTEKLLQRELHRARPSFGFLMEEQGEIPGEDPAMRWVVDPLDGTNNFIHALPFFCISIALQRRTPQGEAQIVAGVIYDPIHNELFSAEIGQGAFMNQQRLQVSTRKKAVEMVCSTVAPKRESPFFAQQQAWMHTALDAGITLRFCGAAALEMAYVAAGRLDGCWHVALPTWDSAAGILIAHEAGATITPLTEGTTAPLHGGSALVANASVQNVLKL